MSKFIATWRLEFDAKDIEEARALHFSALDAMDEAPCAVWVLGDGPVPGDEP